MSMDSTKKMILPTEIKKAIRAIKTNSESGATTLTKQTIQTIHLLLEKTKTSDQHILKKQIQQTLLQLINAQPMMASILTYANTLLSSIDQQQPSSIVSLQEIVQTKSNYFLNTFSEANKKISKHTLPLLSNQSMVFTYSNSSSVTEALLLAHNNNIKMNVYCSESRPTGEGKHIAKLLSRKGIKTRFSTDAALFSKLSKADIILIGADGISTQGLYHKIGTKALAHLAQIHHIPLFSLSAEEKILPASYKQAMQPTKNPEEIIKANNKNLQVCNNYFDQTPLSLMTAIITQNGKKQTKDIITHQKNLILHPCLQTKQENHHP